MVKDPENIQEFSLFGGPLQQLGERLGLVRGKTNTIRLGIALGLLAWGILILLAFLQGSDFKIFSVSVIGVHIRLLVTLPLFFVCETLVAPRMQEFIANIVRSGLVPESELPSLASAVRRVDKLNDPWWVEIFFLIVVFVLPAISSITHPSGKEAGAGMLVFGQTATSLVWGNGWYLGFCLPLFRFLMLRWLWHLGLWWYFLWRLNKIKLHLIPTHPDGAAGLGYLEVVHEHFMPLVLALSAVLAASFAEGISSGTMTLEALYTLVPLVMLLFAVLFIGPLFTFFRKLWVCRKDGLDEYMVMAYRYVQAFDRKWLRDEQANGESQLGTADMQSLADLTNSVRVARDMRLAPVSRRLIMELATCVILPLLPLVFMKYNFDQLSMRLFQMITGQ